MIVFSQRCGQIWWVVSRKSHSRTFSQAWRIYSGSDLKVSKEFSKCFLFLQTIASCQPQCTIVSNNTAFYWEEMSNWVVLMQWMEETVNITKILLKPSDHFHCKSSSTFIFASESSSISSQSNWMIFSVNDCDHDYVHYSFCCIYYVFQHSWEKTDKLFETSDGFCYTPLAFVTHKLMKDVGSD